jgi:maltose O-acetyltransferase
VTICPGVGIGDRAVIGAGSVVTRNIPEDSLAAGNPAKVVKKLNEFRQ